jgi:hypothetical protein
MYYLVQPVAYQEHAINMFLGPTTTLAVTSIVEFGVFIIAGSLATMRPLMGNLSRVGSMIKSTIASKLGSSAETTIAND